MIKQKKYKPKPMEKVRLTTKQSEVLEVVIERARHDNGQMTEIISGESSAFAYRTGKTIRWGIIGIYGDFIARGTTNA
jgi:hypothetical protein